MQIKLLKTSRLPIYDQLCMEEALLRTSQANYCFINYGSPESIVMGISGKRHELIDEDVYRQAPCPVIRRFSGGGTVLINESTLFITFIINAEEVNVPLYPVPIMEWTAQWYTPFFPENFSLRENDYTLDSLKCGGNAQCLIKKRFLHHTTWLWDFDPKRMALLKTPSRQPKYRQARPHTEFLTPLKEIFTSPEVFISHFEKELSKQFSIQEVSYRNLGHFLDIPHRRATKKHC